mgnify:CR=1 FL=1
MGERIKKCIGLIFGGNSNEHSISIKSAISIFDALSSEPLNKIYLIKCFYINKNGLWFSNEDSLSVLKHESRIKDFQSLHPSKELKLFPNFDYCGVDIWFPILHGMNGEDGSIQGFLSVIQKPFVGSGILGSALGMDKIIAKQIFSHLKIPQVKYLPIQNINLKSKFEIENISNKIIENFDFPIFIKPANSGSSIGISKITKTSQIIKALKKAWEIDKRIVVEEGIDAREIECGVIGKIDLKASEVGEVVYESDWYDYDSKYKSNNQIIIPAEIDLSVKKKIQDFAIKSCKILNINVFARVDFFLKKDTNDIYINEINTIPGFTNKSMFPLLWKASGLEINQLVAKLIDISIEL